MEEYKLQPAELLNAPLACVMLLLQTQSWSYSKIPIRGRSRGWIIMVIRLDLHVTPHW